MIDKVLEYSFLGMLLFNAALFIPQLILLIKTRDSSGVSVTMYSGFLGIQFILILHSVIKHDIILFVGVLCNFIICLIIDVLIIYSKYIRWSRDNVKKYHQRKI